MWICWICLHPPPSFLPSSSLLPTLTLCLPMPPTHVPLPPPLSVLNTLIKGLCDSTLFDLTNVLWMSDTVESVEQRQPESKVITLSGEYPP